MSNIKKSLCSGFYLLLGTVFLLSMYISSDFPVYSIEKSFHRYAQSHFIVNTDLLKIVPSAHLEETETHHYVFAVDSDAAYCGYMYGTGNIFDHNGAVSGRALNTYVRTDQVYAAIGYIPHNYDFSLPLFLYAPQLEADKAQVALTIYDDGRKATVTLKGQAVPDANGVFLFWFDGTEYQLEAPPSIMEIADSHVLYAMAHASDNYFPSWADITLYKDGKAIHTETVHFGEE